jgi:hypothetical protein
MSKYVEGLLINMSHFYIHHGLLCQLIEYEPGMATNRRMET